MTDLEATLDAALSDVESWQARIDHAPGQALTVLCHATDRLLTWDLSDEEAEASATVAEAWRDLAIAWQDRQRHEVELARAVDGGSDDG